MSQPIIVGALSKLSSVSPESSRTQRTQVTVAAEATESTDAVRATPRRRLHWLQWLMRAVLIGVVSLAIVFLLLVLGVRMIVVPHIGGFRDDITTQLGKAIGRQVSMGTIEAGWDGWSPTLSMADLKLFDVSGREALTFPHIETSVSWQSVMLGEIRLRRLDVSGAQLLIPVRCAFAPGQEQVRPNLCSNDSRLSEGLVRQRCRSDADGQPC